MSYLPLVTQSQPPNQSIQPNQLFSFHPYPFLVCACNPAIQQSSNPACFFGVDVSYKCLPVTPQDASNNQEPLRTTRTHIQIRLLVRRHPGITEYCLSCPFVQETLAASVPGASPATIAFRPRSPTLRPVRSRTYQSVMYHLHSFVYFEHH